VKCKQHAVDALAAKPEIDAAKARIAEKSAPVTNPILKHLAKPARSTAIKAMCAHCMGCTKASVEPGFRASIRGCASVDCPLYGFRPYHSRDEAEAEAEAEDEAAQETVQEEEIWP
jgi:hypothetical protein